MANISRKFKKQMIEDFLTRMDANTVPYYMFIGKHTEWEDEDSPDVTTDSIEDSLYKIRNEMMFSKRIKSSDTKYMIQKNSWSGNTAYDHYDHRDDKLANKTFFIVNTSNNVYKCLYNNNGGVSTVEPTSISNTSFKLADGYIWKYMYTVSSPSATQFATTDYIPVDANSTITDTAIAGAIDVIIIDNGGVGYKTVEGTIQQKISNNIFRIETSNISDNNYYTDSSLYITGGASQASLSKIDNYVSNSSGRFVITNTALPNIDVTSEYLISPQVRIVGDGDDCKAYCTVNTSSGSIDDIHILDVGSGYTIANVQIVANTSHGSGAVTTAILPPIGGHGYDAVDELMCNQLAISTNFSNNEGNTVSTEIAYRQSGIIENILDYETGIPYLTDDTVRHVLNINVITPANTVFALNETVTGLTSGAVAIVAKDNSTSNTIFVTSIAGTFQVTESIIGSTTSAVGQINGLLNPQAKYNEGTVLYYDNFEKIQRSNTSVETIKLLLTF